MTTPTSLPSPRNGTPALEAALGLARLVVKAHGSAMPTDIARELLGSLLAGSGATRGALAITQSDVGAERRAPRILAAHGIDVALIPTLVAEYAQSFGDHPATQEHDWARITVSLGEQASQLDGGQHRSAETAHLLLTWEGEHVDEQRVRGQSYVRALRDPIAAVVASMLASERRLELERLVDERVSDHLNAELLGTVSHELRSPLAAIKGYASTLLRHERRLPREERHEFLLAIGEASNRLETIINRLLEISELESGEAVLNRFAMDLVPVVRAAVAEVSASATVRMRPPTPITVQLLAAAGHGTDREPLILADPLAMREVLDNLLENAIKYSPQGGTIAIVLQPAPSGDASARDQLTPEASERGGAFLELTVSDQGIGIPDEHLSRIFDRFHRVDTRLTREVDGLGLGLALCHRIVELHDGAIWAESQPGAGSVFHVVLPVATSA